jgi:hypothetical protein
MSETAFIETSVPETNNLNIEQLQHMIGKLSQTEEGEELKTAMSKLKVALKQNPAACALLLPEDVGEMVKNLYRMTNKGILDDLNPKNKERKQKNVPLTQEQLDGISMEDLT